MTILDQTGEGLRLTICCRQVWEPSNNHSVFINDCRWPPPFGRLAALMSDRRPPLPDGGRELSDTPGAINQRHYRAHQKESVIVLPFPLHKDVVRERLVQAGAPADLADHDRQKAGKVLAEFWENQDD